MVAQSTLMYNAMGRRLTRAGAPRGSRLPGGENTLGKKTLRTEWLLRENTRPAVGWCY